MGNPPLALSLYFHVQIQTYNAAWTTKTHPIKFNKKSSALVVNPCQRQHNRPTRGQKITLLQSCHATGNFFNPAGCWKQTYTFCCCFSLYIYFLIISVRPIISKSTRPIFTNFSGLVELLASALRGKWGQLSPLEKMDEKLKSEKMHKRSVFYVYVIFWEQSGQAGVENGAMLTTYLFR